MSQDNVSRQKWQKDLYEIIFGTHTRMGKLFDIVLLWAILFSVAVVIVESFTSMRIRYGTTLRMLEWLFTIIFTIEYVLRLMCVPNPKHYAKSFFGIIDLFSILPTYLSLVVVGTQSLLVLRALRLLRVFRVFKLGRYLKEVDQITKALSASRNKIIVFLVGLSTIVVILGTVMYLIEGERNGFTSIPKSIYWAIVTMTTVGYGDIAPKTIFGQTLASLVMVLGYSIIVVPAGIFTMEISRSVHSDGTVICPRCQKVGHQKEAQFCFYCGNELSNKGEVNDS